MSEQSSQKPMHSDIEFRNLGKINKANIKIRPFTVIAGCNSSGKSFITKSLYSLFSGVVGTNLESEMISLRAELIKVLNMSTSLYRSMFPNDQDLAAELFSSIGYLRDMSVDEMLSVDNLSFISEFRRTVDNFILSVQAIGEEPSIENTKTTEERNQLLSFSSVMKSMWRSQVNEVLDKMHDLILTPEAEFEVVISSMLIESFSDNFTVSSTRQLVKFGSEVAAINLEGGHGVMITDKVGITSGTISAIKLLNNHPPVYLESPIYWKLADALDASKKALSDTARKRRLENNQLVSQVPKYFFDAMELLDDQVKTEVFSDIAQTIEEAINGSLSINDGGIQYTDKESNASVSLSLTASGVTNLGMIALLLKRGAILPGTFLFIDEPEVHLHPMWQVVLVDVLHQLSKRGVNVVIASHSIDIMKAVENIMDSDDEIDPQEHFGINQLSNDGYSVEVTENNFKRISAIKQDLGKPFYDMFLGA